MVPYFSSYTGWYFVKLFVCLVFFLYRFAFTMLAMHVLVQLKKHMHHFIASYTPKCLAVTVHAL